MGILDPLRRRQPAKQPRGGSGRANYGGFLEQEEYNPELRGRRGLSVFDKMYRTDPDIRRVVWMCMNPIAGGTWSVEPFGGDEATDEDIEVAEATEWALWEFMRPNWTGHLTEALPVGIRSGFAPFEGIWDTVEWNGRKLIAPSCLDLRLPRTIWRWNQDGPKLVSIEQQLPTGGNVVLPAEDLVYYRWGAEGDNWAGTSLLRPAYKPWFFKDRLERLDVIKAERQATGIPMCYPPQNASPEQRTQMEEMLSSLRTSETAYMIAPGPKAEHIDPKEAATLGWTIEMLGHNKAGEGATDLKPSLEYQSDKIAAAFIAEFMRLGQGSAPGGARATADVQQDPFLAAVEGIAGVIETAINDSIVKRFVALNFAVDNAPKLRMSLVDSTSLTELADYVQKLATAGALNIDNELEDYLRNRADLPPANAEERAKREAEDEEDRKLTIEGKKVAMQPKPEPTVPGAPAPKPQPQPKVEPPAKDKKPEAKRFDREMRWWEQVMAIDEIETAIDSARERFEMSAGEPARRLAREMAADALAGKQLTPKVDPKLEEAITSELERLYRTGRATVIEELEAQRPGVTGGAGLADAASRRALARRARLAALSIANRIWQAASRSALSRPGDSAAAQVAGELEAAAALRAEAQLHASGALNQGRIDEAEAHREEIRGSRYTSLLDPNRCTSCATADDDVLRRLNDPVRLAHIPPNPECQGGGRCRCLEFFELKAEAQGYGGHAPEPPEPIVSTEPNAAGEHVHLSGGTKELRELLEDQVAAIEKVHRFPRELDKITVKIADLAKEYGIWKGTYNTVTRKWSSESISLSRSGLEADPPITSLVHELGHHLDAHGFGAGPPHEILVRSGLDEMFSSSDAMAEWWAAIVGSRAYRGLTVQKLSPYWTSRVEMLARSYEQWIATRSGNAVLLAKIAARRGDNANYYWDALDFEPIAAAYDAFFRARGLLGPAE